MDPPAGGRALRHRPRSARPAAGSATRSARPRTPPPAWHAREQDALLPHDRHTRHDSQQPDAIGKLEVVRRRGQHDARPLDRAEATQQRRVDARTFTVDAPDAMSTGPRREARKLGERRTRALRAAPAAARAAFAAGPLERLLGHFGRFSFAIANGPRSLSSPPPSAATRTRGRGAGGWAGRERRGCGTWICGRAGTPLRQKRRLGKANVNVRSLARCAL